MRTNRRMHWPALLLIPSFGVFSPAVSATPIQITASGTLSDFFPPSLPAGTAWSIDWTIDSGATDSIPSANAGEYSGLTGNTTLGSIVVVPQSGSAGYVSVQDGEPGLGIGDDFAQMVISLANGPVIDGVRVERFILTLPPGQYDLFASDALSNIIGLQLADLNGFPLDFQVQLFNPAFSSRYVLHSSIDALSIAAVPTPPTVWLLGTGLAGLGGRRWLRRKISS